jgi:hypothetical protein
MRESVLPGCLQRPAQRARRLLRLRNLLPAAAIALLTLSTPVRADGCLVLLCLAAPSWRAIPQCVAPIRELFRDLARGRPFPTCAMSGAGNRAANRWTTAPTFCPPQYTRVLDGDAGPVYTCDYRGCVSVTINGALFARTWWNFGGETVTEFTETAKTTLGGWDTRFDDDFARWLASQSQPAPADTSGGY